MASQDDLDAKTLFISLTWADQPRDLGALSLPHLFSSRVCVCEFSRSLFLPPVSFAPSLCPSHPPYLAPSLAVFLHSCIPPSIPFPPFPPFVLSTHFLLHTNTQDAPARDREKLIRGEKMVSLAACNTKAWQVKQYLTLVFCVCMCVCVYLCVLVPMYLDLCVGHADGVVSSQNRSSAAEVRFVKMYRLLKQTVSIL
jgi:hypothetical protein